MQFMCKQYYMHSFRVLRILDYLFGLSVTNISCVWLLEYSNSSVVYIITSNCISPVGDCINSTGCTSIRILCCAVCFCYDIRTVFDVPYIRIRIFELIQYTIIRSVLFGPFDLYSVAILITRVHGSIQFPRHYRMQTHERIQSSKQQATDSIDYWI